jgi:hypothetical protein
MTFRKKFRNPLRAKWLRGNPLHHAKP